MAGRRAPVHERSATTSTAVAAENGYVAVGRDGEIITDSRLGNRYAWPEDDPRLRPVPERPLDEPMRALVAEASRTTRFGRDNFWRRHRDLPVAEQVLALVNHRAFQFNSRAAFTGESSAWPPRVAAAVAEGRPVEVVLPAFCVISNPAKRFQPTVPTAAEDVSLLHLGALARLVGDLYDGGATIHLVSDSTFYSTPFGVTSVEAQEYLRRLRRRARELGVDDVVRLHDMSALMGDHLVRFQASFDAWCRTLEEDPCADGISPEEHDRWMASMVASLNTRKLGLSYRQMRAVFGVAAPASPTPPVPGPAGDGEGEVLRLARRALVEYRAIKLAAADLCWEDRVFAGAVRATIHTKHIPVLGLRIYPEYKLRSTLLPYHGIGVISYSTKSRAHHLTVEPEMFVSSREGVTRVVDDDGTTAFYHAPHGSPR